jgi:ClpP class serine protease
MTAGLWMIGADGLESRRRRMASAVEMARGGQMPTMIPATPRERMARGIMQSAAGLGVGVGVRADVLPSRGDQTREDLLKYGDVNVAGYYMLGDWAVVPVCGELYHGFDLWEYFMGNTSYQDLRAAVLEASRDTAVNGILLDVNSPGGTVAGVTELADAVKAVAGIKRIVVLAHDLQCSAAILGCVDAKEVWATPTARVGSVGAVCVIDDYTKLFEESGIKVHGVTDEKLKLTGVPGIEQTPEMLANVAESVGQARDMFFARVEAARGTKGATAEAMKTLNGAVLTAEKAKAAGLVDAVLTIDEVLARLSAGAMEGGGTVPAASQDNNPDRMEMQAMNVDLKTVTMEQLTQANPGLLKLAMAAGVALAVETGTHVLAEPKATIAQLKAAFAGDGEAVFREQQLEAGATMSQAKAAYAEVVKARSVGLAARVGELETENAALKAAKATPESKKVEKPAGHSGVAHQETGGGGGEQGYMALVNAKRDEYMEKDHLSLAVATGMAHKNVRDRHPEAHAQYVAGLQAAGGKKA